MSVVDRFLQEIFDDMILKYRIDRDEWIKELSKLGDEVFSVHELVECSHKRVMREKFPDIERASIFNPRFIVGWLIEEAVKARLGDGKEHKHYKIIEVDGKRYVISGFIDCVTKDGTVVEIKFLSGLYGSPHTHHILQLSLYLWILGKEEGELLEISPEGTVGITVKAATDETVIDLIKNPKIPRWDFECQSCNFESFCAYSKTRERKR
ncbi:MAG: hypothetical protein ABIM44_04955 [candidate division WOR-3 bacterium]